VIMIMIMMMLVTMHVMSYTDKVNRRIRYHHELQTTDSEDVNYSV